MNSKKIAIAVLVLLIVGLALFLYFKKPVQVPEVADASGNAASPAAPVISDNFPFDFGSRGDNVLRMQRALNRIRPDTKIIEDGFFGSATRAKLYTTVSTQLSQLPITKEHWLAIIQKGNQA